jgi:hypothetical protein
MQEVEFDAKHIQFRETIIEEANKEFNLSLPDGEKPWQPYAKYSPVLS